MSGEHTEASTITGHDNDRSAGMPADLHASYACSVYGMGLLTAAITGNSQGTFTQQLMPLGFIQRQFDVLSDGFKIKAVKTGMLANRGIISVIAKNLEHYQMQDTVLDPVIIAKHGATLLTDDAYRALLKKLAPFTTIITPNFFEAQELTGLELRNESEIKQGTKMLQRTGAKNVLIEGSHHNDKQTEVKDYLLLEDSSDKQLIRPYFKTDRTNGTGDTLSAVIAAELTRGDNVKTAVKITRGFTYEAPSHPINVGAKYSPISRLAAQEEMEQ